MTTCPKAVSVWAASFNTGRMIPRLVADRMTAISKRRAHRTQTTQRHADRRGEDEGQRERRGGKGQHPAT